MKTKGENIDIIFFIARFIADLFGALGGWLIIYGSIYFKIANCSFWGYLFGITFIRALFIIGEKWERHFKVLQFEAMTTAFLVISLIIFVVNWVLVHPGVQ